MAQKVLLVNIWHQDNAGDLALAVTAVAAVRARWPGCEVRVLSMLPASSALADGAHRELEASTGCSVAYNPLPIDSRDFKGIGAISSTWALVRACACWLRVLPGSGAPGASEVEWADIVVAVGGHYLFTVTNSIRSSVRLFRVVWPLILARRIGRPYILFSQSLGPFSAPGSMLLARQVLRGAKMVFAREEVSANVARAAGLTENVAVMPDSAFGLEASQNPRSGGLLAITLREPIHGSRMQLAATRRRYLEQMVVAVKELLASGVVRNVVAMPHVVGPTAIEDDRPITEEFVSQCADVRVTIADRPGSLRALVDFYRAADVVVGTRMHSVIFAISQGTPAVAVGYFGPKAIGIMRQIGAESLCLDQSTVEARDIVRATTEALARFGDDRMALVADGLRRRVWQALANATV